MAARTPEELDVLFANAINAGNIEAVINHTMHPAARRTISRCLCRQRQLFSGPRARCRCRS
jgi:hypothetical protein